MTAPFRVTLRSVDGVSATALVNESTGQVVITDEHPQMRVLERRATDAAYGPAPWLPALRILDEWAEEEGGTVVLDDRMQARFEEWKQAGSGIVY